MERPSLTPKPYKEGGPLQSFPLKISPWAWQVSIYGGKFKQTPFLERPIHQRAQKGMGRETSLCEKSTNVVSKVRRM